MNDDRRNIVELHKPTLHTLAVEQVAQQLGLEVVFRQRRVVAQGNDAGDFVISEFDNSGLRFEIRIGAGEYFDGVRAQVIPAHPVAAGIFAVPAFAQTDRDFGGGACIADHHWLWRSVEERRIRERPTGEFLVGESGVLRVEVREQKNADHQ